MLYFAHQTNRVRVFRRWFRSCRGVGSLSPVVSPVAKTVAVAKMTISKTISTIQKVGVSLSLGGSLSLPLAVVVAVVAKTVVAKTVAVSPQSTIQKVRISLSLGGSLSLSLPLAVVEASVAKTVATVAVAKTVAKTVVVGISLCLGFRLSGSDGCKSENYELKRRRELKERKKVVGCFFTKEVIAGALTNFMLSAE